MSTALVLIDVQNAILAGLGAPDRQAAIASAFDATVLRLQALMLRARKAGIPIAIVQHDDPADPYLTKGGEGWQLRREIVPAEGDILVRKQNCDSFFETDLEQRLAERSVSNLVVGGCVTPFCIDTTVRRAVSLGYDVTLVADGHMTGDIGKLTFSDVIDHYNTVLDGFNAGRHRITLRLAGEIAF